VSRQLDRVRRDIDAHGGRARYVGQVLGQAAVAAADIQQPITGPERKPVNDTAQRVGVKKIKRRQLVSVKPLPVVAERMP
jgi:hypothetical protein